MGICQLLVVVLRIAARPSIQAFDSGLDAIPKKGERSMGNLSIADEPRLLGGNG